MTRWGGMKETRSSGISGGYKTTQKDSERCRKTLGSIGKLIGWTQGAQKGKKKDCIFGRTKKPRSRKANTLLQIKTWPSPLKTLFSTSCSIWDHMYLLWNPQTIFYFRSPSFLSVTRPIWVSCARSTTRRRRPRRPSGTVCTSRRRPKRARTSRTYTRFWCARSRSARRALRTESGRARRASVSFCRSRDERKQTAMERYSETRERTGEARK